MIRFFVNAIPVAQPRQRTRVVQANGRAFAQNYTPSSSPVNVFKTAIQADAIRHFRQPLEGPLRVTLEFVFPRLKRQKAGREWKTSKPDCDNLAKAVLDACNQIAFRDDAQAAVLVVRKALAADGEQPGVSVTIEPLE